MSNSVVIVGGGHAGVQTALSLREEGFTGRITVLDRHAEQPYERPPLSKAWLKGEVEFDALTFRNTDVYASLGIEIRTGICVTHIDRQTREVHWDRGSLHYEHLVLALGTEPHRLPIPGVDLEGVHRLHTFQDARTLTEALDSARSFLVIGGGFIGLEAAAAARGRGLPVRVLEAGERVMQRAVTPSISAFYEDLHAESGTTITRDTFATALLGYLGKVRSVRLSNGETLVADCVLLGVGVSPMTQLAAQAGLSVGNGIVVDGRLTTSDPNISAVGDCASYPLAGSAQRIRLESVQNAVDHARLLARKLTGGTDPYDEVPWFWTDQLGCKLQMSGLTADADEYVVLGDPAKKKFSVLCWRDGVLLGGESVNSPGDHITLRRLLARQNDLTPTVAQEQGFTLKGYLKSLDVQPVLV